MDRSTSGVLAPPSLPMASPNGDGLAPSRPLTSVVETLVAYLTYPLVVFGGTALVAFDLGIAPSLRVMIVVLAAWIVLLTLERTFPETPEWNPSWKTLGLDALHNVVSGGVAKLVEIGLVVGLVSLGALAAEHAAVTTLWPGEWPLVAQVGLALLVADFGVYWAHRTFHFFVRLWPIHALHHSSEQMHALATGRSHPINVIAYHSLAILPLMLLGAPEMIMLLVGTFTALTGIAQHANINLRTGVLNLVFATTELHRWHHSQVLEESNTNFGGVLIVWDWVFGTRFCPSDRRARHRVGIEGVPYPTSYWKHLISPFVYGKWERDGAELDTQ